MDTALQRFNMRSHPILAILGYRQPASPARILRIAHALCHVCISHVGKARAVPDGGERRLRKVGLKTSLYLLTRVMYIVVKSLSSEHIFMSHLQGFLSVRVSEHIGLV